MEKNHRPPTKRTGRKRTADNTLVYPLSEYEEDGTLRVGLLLWGVIFYASRHILLLLLGALSAFIGARSGLDTKAVGVLLSSPLFLPASIPAAVVLGMAVRRRPKAGRWLRACWAQGRWCLLAAIALDLLLLIAHRFTTYPHGITVFSAAWALADVYVAMYLMRSVRVRAVFADFPAHPVPR